ncbi:hypothetical protein GCM10020295_62350 [Streptomyces cinereospinus]
MTVYAAAYRERVHALATGAKSDEVPPFTLDTAGGRCWTRCASPAR